MPVDHESRGFVSRQVAAAKAARREGSATWFDHLDVDDFATLDGKGWVGAIRLEPRGVR